MNTIPGIAGRVQQGGQHQGGPGEASGRDLIGQVHGQRPRHAGMAERGVVQARAARCRAAGPRVGHSRAALRRRAGVAHPALPVVVPAPVVAATGPGADQRGRGVRQRERLAVHVVRQIQGLGPLARVGGEPGGEIGQGFPGGERGDRRDPPVRRDQCVAPAGCDHDPAVGPAGPQAIQVGRVSQVIEDHQPPPLGAGQPGQEALSAGQQVVAGVGGAQFREGQPRSRSGSRSGCWPSPRPAGPRRGYPTARAPAPRPAASCHCRQRRRGRQGRRRRRGRQGRRRRRGRHGRRRRPDR